ncbi:alginate lyase [Ceratobasidium sp. AG-Ba]|nr:alginate lyase [Ceratobasidium sp. AG-Ba]
MRWMLSVAALAITGARAAFPSYPNEFVAPSVLLNASIRSETTLAAQRSIIKYADEILREGPWSVMNKSVNPPTGTSSDYLSYRPYYWPDCSNVGNTTELTQEQIYVTCPYVRRDGQFNPDYRLANDSGSVQALMDAILYAPMAHLILTHNQSLSKNPPEFYSRAALHALNVFFVNPQTAMNPHLNFSQLLRGPGVQKGSPTGVLDLHWWPKALTGILLMRAMNVWSEQDIAGVVAWGRSYIPWLLTNELARAERGSDNNHASYFYNQLAALQILVGDNEGARATLQDFFTGVYQEQIDANGDQPKESARTHPYHYRGYNLCAIITSARLAEYIGYDAWNIKAASGAGIQDAANYAMGFTPGPGEAASELFPQIAAVAVKFGDPDGKYAAWLASKDQQYPARLWFFWDQPLSDSGLAAGLVAQGGSNDDGGPTDGEPDDDNTTGGTGSGGKNGAGAVQTSVALALVGLAVGVLGWF